MHIATKLFLTEKCAIDTLYTFNLKFFLNFVVDPFISFNAP